MTPEEFKTKVEKLHTLIVEKLSELEEDPTWGEVEERAEIVEALDELALQAQAMSATLHETE